jgi:hypothetical protein
MSWLVHRRQKSVVVGPFTTNAPGVGRPGRHIWPRSHSSPGPSAGAAFVSLRAPFLPFQALNECGRALTRRLLCPCHPGRGKSRVSGRRFGAAGRLRPKAASMTARRIVTAGATALAACGVLGTGSPPYKDRRSSLPNAACPHRAAKPVSGVATLRDMAPLFDAVERAPRFLARRLRGAGLELQWAGTARTVRARQGEPTARIAGPPGELLLYLFGRQGVAHVEVSGPAAAVEAVRRARFGL